MRQPEGFKVRGQKNKVICLQCALYGLKQARLAWWKELNSSINELGFKHLMSDVGLFVCKDFKEIIIAIVYVDDAMFFGRNKAQVDSKKKLFMDKCSNRSKLRSHCYDFELYTISSLYSRSVLSKI
jgi:Reverse transcriptase (RNA-dependent DNA polymerase)